MVINKNLYFALLSIGLVFFLIIFTAGIFYDLLIIPSVVMFFVLLTLLLLILVIYSIKYVNQFKDIKGKIFIGLLLLSRGYYLFVSIITLLVLDH